jgi:hypothetical protein
MGIFSAAFTAARLFLGKVSPKTWFIIGAAALLVGGFFLHQHKAKQALAAAYAQGSADRDAAWQKRLDAEHKAALEWKAKAEAVQSKISTETGKHHEETIRDISARAVSQRVHGPGAAAAPDCRSSGVAGVSSGASDRATAGGSAGASMAGLPSSEGLAVVPWDDLVSLGAGSDAWRSEALTWRDWYARQAEANAAARAALGSK